MSEVRKLNPKLGADVINKLLSLNLRVSAKKGKGYRERKVYSTQFLHQIEGLIWGGDLEIGFVALSGDDNIFAY